LIFFIIVDGSGQSISVNIDAKDKPLKELCFELSKSHNIQFSFNDKVVKNCTINHQGEYKSIQEAIIELLNNCGLKSKMINDVVLIYESPELLGNVVKAKPVKYYLRAEVIDNETNEALPYANIQIDANQLITNADGNFTARTMQRNSRVKISYVGYEILDTTLTFSSELITLKLKSSATQLEEFVISASDQDKSGETEILGKIPKMSKRVGHVKLNPQLAQLLPGGADNTLFNLTRLQPGILAAGEQTNEFTIWGSYKGQTLVQFDGMTLFSLGSNNPQVGPINPLLIKDIEVHKGGFNADLGNRVGGFINITGKEGNKDEINGIIKLTNETVSSLINLPVLKSGVVQVGVRKTHNLLNIGRIEGFRDVDFFDMNLKYTQDIGDFNKLTISIRSDQEDAIFDLNNERKPNEQSSKQDEMSKQNGASLNFKRIWNNIGVTDLTLVHSDYSFNLNKEFMITPIGPSPGIQNRSIKTFNSIGQNAVKLNHKFPKHKKHQFNFGFEFMNNNTVFIQDSIGDNVKQGEISENRGVFFIKDRVAISKRWTLIPGLRVDGQKESQAIYLQPRIQSNYKVNAHLNFNFAYGIYNQFLTENAISEAFGNQYYFWSISTMKEQVNRADHYVIGGSIEKKGWSFKMEGFYKNLSNLNRYYFNKDDERIEFSSDGKANTIGMDLFISKSLGKHYFWTSYTLSNTQELFSYFINNKYHRAPQDQMHEFKTAAIFNFKPFYFSANYVYGSGLQVSFDPNKPFQKTQDYKRLDIAGSYRKKLNKTELELGLSILNVLNTRNIRYDDFSAFPDQNFAFRRATPFRPSIFLNFNF
jgi:outer membrane receptor protein involved in Fe transport